MKNLKTLIVIVFTSLLVSCGTTKETNSISSNQNRGRSNVETTSNSNSKKVTNSRIARKEATATAQRLAEIEDEMYFKRMYSDLEMTDLQIANFEKEWEEIQNSWKRSNRNKVMNNYERTEYQDRILKKILDESEFKSYQEWVRVNANRK